MFLYGASYCIEHHTLYRTSYILWLLHVQSHRHGTGSVCAATRTVVTVCGYPVCAATLGVRLPCVCGYPVCAATLCVRLPCVCGYPVCPATLCVRLPHTQGSRRVAPGRGCPCQGCPCQGCPWQTPALQPATPGPNEPPRHQAQASPVHTHSVDRVGDAWAWSQPSVADPGASSGEIPSGVGVSVRVDGVRVLRALGLCIGVQLGRPHAHEVP